LGFAELATLTTLTITRPNRFTYTCVCACICVCCIMSFGERASVSAPSRRMREQSKNQQIS